MVLVLDDELSTFKALARLAKAADTETSHFSDAAALLAALPEHVARCQACRGALCIVLDVKFLTAVLAAPGVHLSVPIPVICVQRYRGPAQDTSSAGFVISAWLTKPFSLREMDQAFKSALDAYTTRSEASRLGLDLQQGFACLTPRESQVCDMVVQGMTNKRISELLGITLKTVKAHRAKVMAKTEAKSLAELVRAYDSWRNLTAGSAGGRG